MAQSKGSSVFRRRWPDVKILLVVIGIAQIMFHNAWAAQSFQEEPGDTSVLIGEAVVVLKCVVSEKAGSLFWFKEENVIAHDRDPAIGGRQRYSIVGNASLGEYNLQIRNVVLEDDGEFQCKVTIAADNPGIASRMARLIIKRAPSTTTLRPSDAVLSVVVGVATNLTCQATDANPPAEIAWLRAGSAQAATHSRAWHPAGDNPSGKLTTVASALTLSPAVGDHAVLYQCQISHLALAAPTTLGITLDVQHTPVVVVELSQTPIREDTSIIFRCVVDANPRKVAYLWTKNAEPISGASDNHMELVIAKEDHMASITCTAENTIGVGSGSVTTPVLYGPRFLDIPVSVSVDEEGPAQMSCTADGNPAPTIKWTRLGSRATLSTMQTLQFDLVRQSDVGTYVCIATVPGFDPVMSYGRLDINAIPEISSPAEQKAGLGNEATLECFTNTKPDPYMVIWTRDDQQLEEGTAGRFTVTKREISGGVLSELIIDEVLPGDFGVYNCTLVNEVGDMSLLITLIQQDLDLIVWIIIAVIGTAAVIFVLTIIVMVCCRRKWRRRRKAVSLNKGQVQLEIVRKLTDADDKDDGGDGKSGSYSYDYNATPPSTPGKPRYSEPYHFARGRRDSFDDPHYRAPRHQSDAYSYDGRHPDRYLDNEYSEPIVRKRKDDDHVSYRSDRSEDYARGMPSDGRYDDSHYDAMHDNEVKQYNSRDPRYADDTRYDDDRSYGDRSYGDRSYGDRSYGDRSYGDKEDRRYSDGRYDDRRYDGDYPYEDGSEKGSEISQVTRNKLATNV